MVEIDDNNDDDDAQHTPPIHQTLTLALPIQHAANSNGIAPAPAPAPPSSDDTWSDGATSAIIDAWAHRYLYLGRGILKHHHWQEVAAAVASKSEIQCKHRIETLKKRYRSEKSKTAPSSWPFFHRFDRLLGANLKAPPPSAFPPPPRQFPQKMRTPTTIANSKKRSRSPKKREGVSVLMEAITRFGEVYERVERSRAERVVEMEKQRMGFVREVEMQRMQFISQLKLHSNSKWEGTRRRRRRSP